MQFMLVSSSDDLESLDYEHHSYHEVVTSGKARKFMLDIDLDSPVSRTKVMELVAYFRQTVAKVVSEICKNWAEHKAREEDLHLFLSPNNDGTFSGFHLVLGNFMFSSSADIDIVFSAVQKQHRLDSAYLSTIDGQFGLPKILDPAVLRRTFSMRLPRSCKLTAGRLVRRKEYCPSQEQIDEQNDYIEHGILTEAIDDTTHHVKLIMSDEQSIILRDEDIDDETLASAVKRVLAVQVGETTFAEHFHFRSAKGGCINFDKSSGSAVMCLACKREHTNDNFLYAVGDGISAIGGTISLMCRKSKRAITTLLPESKYPFDLKAVQGLGKTDANNALKKQKKDHKEAIYEAIREKENAYRASKAAKGASVSARSLKERFDPERRKMLKELDDSFFNATKSLCKSNSVGEISVESLKQYVDENHASTIDVAKYQNYDFRKIRQMVFSSIEDLVSFMFTTYWWSHQDGIWIKSVGKDGDTYWERLSETSDGLSAGLVSHYHAKVEYGTESVKFVGHDLWKPMASFCEKKPAKFVPEPLCLASAIDPAQRRYEMDPTPESFVNLWRGLTGKYSLQQHFNPEKHDEYIRELEYLLLNNLSDGKQEYFDYLVSWLASAMQRPDRKTGVLILLSGRRGIGKSQLISALSAIVPHARQDTKGLANLTGRFNSHLESSTLYMFPESPQSSAASAAEFAELKSLITESDEFTIEQKGIDQKRVQLYHNYLVASNFNSSVELEDGDRRFCIIPNQDAPHGHEDKEYWAKMHPMLNSNEFRASFQRYLLTRDISNFDVRSFPKHDVRNSVISRTPITEYVLSTPHFRQLLLDSCRSVVSDEHHPHFGNTRIDVPTLEAIVKLYSRDNKLSGGQVAYQVKTLKHEVNENEELRKVIRLYDADKMGFSTHTVTIKGLTDGSSLATEQRKYSHALYFVDDETDGTAVVDDKCKIADLQRQLDEMKQLLTLATQKKTVPERLEVLESLIKFVANAEVDYTTWTTPQLQNELRKRKITFRVRDNRATLLKLVSA